MPFDPVETEARTPQEDAGHALASSFWPRALILIVFLGVLFLLHREFDLLQYFTQDRIDSTIGAMRARVDQFGLWGPLLFVGAAAVAMLVNVPVVLLICSSVMLFGYVTGGVFSFLIVCTGITLIYWVARRLGRPLVKRLFGGTLEKVEERLLRRELMNVIIVRLILYMSPSANWSLSVCGVRYRNLLLGTVLGAGPGILLNIWLSGALLQSLRTGDSLNLLEHRQLLVPVALGILLLIVMRLVDQHQRRQIQSSHSRGGEASRSR